MQVTDEMVGRFISWELPADFKSRRIGYLYKVTHPLGMDLLATDEARAMLEHVLGGEPEREPVEQEGGTWTNYFTAQKIEAERYAKLLPLCSGSTTRHQMQKALTAGMRLGNCWRENEQT